MELHVDAQYPAGDPDRATIIVLREPLWGVSRVTSDAATPVPG